MPAAQAGAEQPEDAVASAGAAAQYPVVEAASAEAAVEQPDGRSADGPSATAPSLSSTSASTRAASSSTAVGVGTAPTAVAEKSGGVVATMFRFQSVFGLLAVFVAAIIFSPRRDGEILFVSADNLANVVRAVSEIGIIAVGMTFVILIGGSICRWGPCSGWRRSGRRC
ncbi:hypothetical protein [Kribbella ginsengisoli]|uniref:hypothetical protein n=1 Tax=Kribbella ginsengisoli TaxID=363865 RepID=UPI0031DD4CD1